MAVPSINETFETLIRSSGAEINIQFSATNTPTSWAVSGQPSGLTITNDGLLTGAQVVTASSVYTVSVTATNGDGTSTASNFVLVISPLPAGGTRNSYALPMDMDVDLGHLVLPGLTEPQPKPQTDPPTYLAEFTSGERREIALGLVSRAVLQDLPVDLVKVTFRRFTSDRPILLTDGVITVINEGSASDGGNDSRRYLVPIYISPAAFSRLFAQSRGARKTSVEGLLEIQCTELLSAADYDSTLLTENIAAIDESDLVTKTFDINLDDEVAAAKYLIELDAVFPTDNGLDISLTPTLIVRWNGSSYSASPLEGASSGSGSSTVAADWDTSLSISVEGDATGLQVEASLTSSSQTDGKWRVVIPLQNYTVYDNAGSLELNASGSENWTFVDDSDGQIYVWAPTGGDDEGFVEGDIGTGLSETVSVSFDDANDEVIVVLPADTAVAAVKFENSSPEVTTVPNPSGPNYTDASITCRVTGVEEADAFNKLISEQTSVIVHEAQT